MNIPTLRIELDGVRNGLVTHLQSHHAEIEQMVADAIARFDLESELQVAVRSELPTLLRRALHEAVQSALYDDEVSGELQRLVVAALLGALREKQ